MAEIGQTRSPNDPGLSVGEWAVQWGQSEDKVYRHLRQLKAQGKLVRGQRWAADLTDRGYWMPVYRLRTRAKP